MSNVHQIPAPEALSPARRARILEGAAAVFMQGGFEGASMSQIATAARVSKGTLYNYFPGKQDLFAAVVRQRCERLVEEVFGEPESSVPLGDLTAQLTRIGRTMLRTMVSRDGQAIFRVAVMEASKFPDLAQAFLDSGPNVMVGRMAAWLTRQIEAGHLRPHEPLFAAEQFFALTQARVLMRARTDAGYRASDAEIDFVVDGAARVFLAAYGV
jgi:AcrR family transcriptional regulator